VASPHGDAARARRRVPVLLSAVRIQFFGGKGGVGKTTLAAAHAVAFADGGTRTLLVSTDPAHSTSDVLATRLTSEPRGVADGLWAMEIDPAIEADRYVADVKARIQDTTPPRLWQEVERQIDVARVSPGAQEAALFERMARLLETEGAGYDRIVFDTAPTGQTLQLLSLPEMMQAWMTGLIGRRRKLTAVAHLRGGPAGRRADGPRGDPVLAALEERHARFVRARGILTDRTQTAFHFVVTPERLPILETERAVAALDRYGIPVGTVFVNRVLPRDAEGAFLAQRRERERGCLDRIAATFGRHRLLHIPLQRHDVVGLPALRSLRSTVTAGS
jgi:arsenite/tail-anchored protein-transporting ATPase